jgi:hypothetical protein
MNRADLSWALNAVLPHVGNEKNGLNQVGLDFRDGSTFVYATDKYTAAIARVNDGMDFRGALPVKEATDLMRYVRPDRVPERAQEIVYAQAPGELHIGNVNDYDESQVFETCEPKVTLDYLLTWIRGIDQGETEYDELILAPKLVEKFAKAQRSDADRLWILPRRLTDRYGAAVMALGADFIGAVAGMTYDQQSTARVASFLYLEPQQAAA